MKIFFDIDGVLGDFDTSAANVPGYSSGVNKSSKLLSDAELYNKKRNWRAIEKVPNFWLNMKPVMNINLLLDYAQSCGEMFVLSKVPGADKFAGGEGYVQEIINAKQQWIQKYFSQYFYPKNVFICQGDKVEFMNPGPKDVLIDDRYENIVNWYDAGGMGILFKNPSRAMRELQLIRQR